MTSADVRYLWRSAAGIALALGAIAALNVIADPYGRFGTPRWRGINDAWDHVATDLVDRPIPVEGGRYRLHADARPVVLVGTSAVMLGFDTRRHPEAFNAGLSGTTLPDALTLAVAAFARPCPARLVLVEALPPQPPDDVPPPDLYDWAVAFPQTVIALRVIAASMLGAGRAHAGTGDFARTLDPMPSLTSAALDRNVIALRASMASLTVVDARATRRSLEPLRRSCAAAQGTVLLFVPPRHPRILADGDLLRFQASWLQTLRAAVGDADTSSCRMRVVDLSGAGPTWREDDFASLTHFRPTVGEWAYARLLAESDSGAPHAPGRP